LNIGYTFLNLDRSLNFLGFAKKFTLPNQKDQGAGLSLGWINSGVGNIDIRDNDTKHIDFASTFENQFYLGTGFLMSDKLAFGIAFKLYYAKLYEGVTTNSIAFDFGATYKATDNLAFGFAVKDLAARYKWETSDLYGSLYGNTTENKFPTIINFGASCQLNNKRGNASLELGIQRNPDKINKNSAETSDSKQYYFLRGGIEYNFSKDPEIPIIVRAGLDRIELNGDDLGGSLKPTLGFSLMKNLSGKVALGIDYAFQYEPYTHYPVNNLGLTFKFK
jgi:hypothetical protein